jgi:hypothetical protein
MGFMSDLVVAGNDESRKDGAYLADLRVDALRLGHVREDVHLIRVLADLQRGLDESAARA